MARSINSPGVQINEIDLSQYIQPQVGTQIYTMGYASQGPTDEVIQITSASELERIYGIPETPAERYFHYTCRELLNSPGTLLTTRLPYGSGSGAGFTNQYSALLYPVYYTDTAGTNFEIGTPTQVSLTDSQYQDILQGNVTWSSVVSSTNSAPLTGAYSASYVTSSRTLNAGIVVLNTSQTTVNEVYEGYYITLTDNKDIGPDTDFTSVNTVKSISDSGSFVTVPQSRLSFKLSATNVDVGSDSVSETIESIPTYSFGSNYYKDSLIVTLFKVRSSIYDTGLLTTALTESYIGSFDRKKQIVGNTGAQTFYLQDVINNTSSNIKILINPNISEKTSWTATSTGDPDKSVTINNNNRALYSVGTYAPTFTNTNKFVGNVKTKVQRALTLVESPEIVDIDVIVDGGLTTIYAAASGVSGDTAEFDDRKVVNSGDLTNSSSSLLTRWSDLFKTFNNFAQNIRKDCIFIGDPLRYIFVNGTDTKTSSKKSFVFSNDIYTPLKTCFSGIESNYSATYGNWVKVYDSYSDSQFWAPFSGYAGAVYARTDTVAQPWIAPAGLNRGVVNNVLDIGFNPNQKQRDFLYPISINPVVFFPNGGYVIFGQKTLQTRPTAFDRVNVRRLFLALEKAVNKALRFFVFEPNTEFTRTRLKNTITPIFELAKNTEGVYDYLIVCDERNNTPDSIDRNELNVDIYIKPVKAAEFILVNFIATRTGQNFEELI